MKHLRFLPFAFLAGAHGFAILAPYIAVCMTAYTLHLQRKRRLAAIVQPLRRVEAAEPVPELVAV